VAKSHDYALEREQQESPEREESRQVGDGQVDDEASAPKTTTRKRLGKPTKR